MNRDSTVQRCVLLRQIQEQPFQRSARIVAAGLTLRKVGTRVSGFGFLGLWGIGLGVHRGLGFFLRFIGV